MLLLRDITRSQLWECGTIKQKEMEGRLVAKSLADVMRVAEAYYDADSMGHESFDEDDDDGYFTPDESEVDPTCVLIEVGGDVILGANETLESKQSIFEASDLRMHLALMSVITRSQQKCLSLWKDKRESPKKNDTFLNITTRSTKRGMKASPWTSSNMELYLKLVQWRDDVANEVGVHPSMFLPLDLLVLIAYKCPRSKNHLRQLCYFLPDFLESGEKASMYLDQVFAIVSSVASDQHIINVSCYGDYLKRRMSAGGQQSRLSKVFWMQSSAYALMRGGTLPYVKAITCVAFVGTVTAYWIGIARKRR